MDSDEDTKDGIIVHPDDPVPWFPGQEEDLSPEFDHPDKKARLKRRRRCGQCGPCQIRTNCGQCSYCLRRSVLKQSCIYRKCIYLRKPVSGTAKTPPRRRPNGNSLKSGSYQDFISSSCDEELDSSYEMMSPPGIEVNGFAVGEATNGDDTEILIEDYTPSPSIIIGGYDDDPQDSQPSSPVQISIDREEQIKTPPHPMDGEDNGSCVNPRQLNALRAAKEIESSCRTTTPDNVRNVSGSESVSQSSCDHYSLSVVQNEVQNNNDKDSDLTTENSTRIQSALEKNPSGLKFSLELTQNKLSECHSAISSQLAEEVPWNSSVETQSKPHKHTQIMNRADSFEHTTGSARLPILPPTSVPSHHLSSSLHDSTSFHNFQVPKPQSISATYDEAHRQFFSPPNVTVTGHGGFSSPNSSHDTSGSQSHKSLPVSSYASNDFDQYPRGPHPTWYPGLPIHPHTYPHFGIPRGMYPPHYAYDPMVYPVHPTQNPFHRLEGFGSHPMHPVILPRMVKPRFYPYRRHPSEHCYRPNSPASDPDFSKHPDFRKRPVSVSRPNSGNERTGHVTSVREEIEEYKKHSVFRLRANSLEKTRSLSERDVGERSNHAAASASDVSENVANSEPPSLSRSSVPTNRNNALRKLLCHTSTLSVESPANSAVDDDLQNEMRKIGHNPCSVGNIDELRMPNLVRGDAVNVESSSPNSSNSSDSASTSPLLSEKIMKGPLTTVTNRHLVSKSVKILGNVCIKQDLGDEGIIMLEFQGCKVDLVQCVLDEDILKLSKNPTELKYYILNSQSTTQTTSQLPVQNGRISEPVAESSDSNHENSIPCSDVCSSRGVLALANICAAIESEPPQLQKLGVIVGENGSETDKIQTQPESPTIGQDTEGWKQSYLKMFSIRHHGTAEETHHAANSEKNHVIAIGSLSDVCETDPTAHLSNLTHPQKAWQEIIDKTENAQISDKNIFDSHRPRLDSPDLEIAKTRNFESGQNPLKRNLVEVECEESDAKRLKQEIRVPNENNNEIAASKSETIVKNLSKFVENTIELYSNEDPLVIVEECDATLMCDEYQNSKESLDYQDCKESVNFQDQKESTEIQDHEFLSEKTLTELKKKILNRNS